MLVLTVKQDGKVRIGDVVIEVRQIKGKQIRLGFEAPRDTRIERLDREGNWTNKYTPPAEPIHAMQGKSK